MKSDVAKKNILIEISVLIVPVIALQNFFFSLLSIAFFLDSEVTKIT